MVGEPGASQPFGAEDLGPLLECQIACDQRGSAFMALAEGLEEQFVADQLLLEAQRMVLVAGFSQFAD